MGNYLEAVKAAGLACPRCGEWRLISKTEREWCCDVCSQVWLVTPVIVVKT